jgi:hypothetical protein
MPEQEEWLSAGFLFHKTWLFAFPSDTYKLHVLYVGTYDEIWAGGCLSNRNSFIGKLSFLRPPTLSKCQWEVHEARTSVSSSLMSTPTLSSMLFPLPRPNYFLLSTIKFQ